MFLSVAKIMCPTNNKNLIFIENCFIFDSQTTDKIRVCCALNSVQHSRSGFPNGSRVILANLYFL